MGLLFSYECPKCGYKDELAFGGAETDEKYVKDLKAREDAFKNDILRGRYGERLCDLYGAHADEFEINCNTDFIQCEYCLAIQRINHKRLTYDCEEYTETIDMKQDCRKCGKPLRFYNFDRFNLMCPKCKESSLKSLALTRF